SPDVLSKEAPTKEGEKPKTFVTTQKVMQAKEDKPATWADGSRKPAEGVYWVFSIKEVVADQPQETVEEKTIVVCPVGDPASEAKIDNPQRAVFNLPAVLIGALVTLVLVKGISESAGFNALMVAIKLAAVLFVIAIGAYYVKQENWTREFAPYGWTGV